MHSFDINTNLGIILCHGEITANKRSILLKMALDTGATYTIIPYEAAQLAGLNPIRAKEQICLKPS